MSNGDVLLGLSKRDQAEAATALLIYLEECRHAFPPVPGSWPEMLLDALQEQFHEVLGNASRQDLAGLA